MKFEGKIDYISELWYSRRGTPQIRVRIAKDEKQSLGVTLWGSMAIEAETAGLGATIKVTYKISCYVTNEGLLLNNTHTSKAVINGKTCNPMDDVKIDNNKKSTISFGDWYKQRYGDILNKEK